MKAILVLADGITFEGKSFGASGEKIGEVVFNTSMTGYQEIMTDPSYNGQIVTMTYPLIGNYGINEEDIESSKPQVEGFIVKEFSSYPSNWRYKATLNNFLEMHGIVGIYGIDTRALTRHIRDKGAQQAIISTEDFDRESLLFKVRSSPGLIGRDLVQNVTCKAPYIWDEGRWDLKKGYRKNKISAFKVLAYDFGIKRNILRMLADHGCNVTVIPAYTKAEDVIKMNPDGICLSNGPGDPEAVTYAIENLKKLIHKKPILGICLGHQILALALGGKTYKLKFGHRGGNQPVMDLNTGKVEITSQNHGFAVDMESLKNIANLTHINLNDNSVEGLAHENLPIFSVQYHPEASPGPHDSHYLFEKFIKMMKDAS